MIGKWRRSGFDCPICGNPSGSSYWQVVVKGFIRDRHFCVFQCEMCGSYDLEVVFTKVQGAAAKQVDKNEVEALQLVLNI